MTSAAHHLNLTGGEFVRLMPGADWHEPSRGGLRSVSNGRAARQEDVTTDVDRDARSALMILAVCTFIVVFAAIIFIASGGAQIVRSEIPTSWVNAGLQAR